MKNKQFHELNMKENMFRKRSIFVGASLLALVVIFLLGIFYDYDYRNSLNVRQHYQSVVEEENEQARVVINQKLKDQLYLLDAYAKLLAQQSYHTSEEVFQVLSPLLDTGDFLRTGFVDSQGHGYSSDGSQQDVSKREYFIEGMKGNRYVSNMLISLNSQQKVITMTVPIWKGQEVSGVLRAVMDINSLGQYFDIPVLSGQARSYLLQSDGLNLTSDESTLENLFSKMEENNNDPELIKELKGKFANHQNGNFLFRINGQEQFVSYSSIEQTDWILLTTLPNEVIYNHTNKNFYDTFILAMKVVFLMFGLYLYFAYRQKKGMQIVKSMNASMEAIITNTPGVSYKYCVKDQATLTFFNDSAMIEGYPQEEVLELARKGELEQMVDSKDRQRIHAVLKDLAPNTVITNTYRLHLPGKETRWIMEHRQIILEEGEPTYYVEVLDVTDLKQAQQELQVSEERYRLILDESQLVIFDWDLEQDSISFSEIWTKKYGYPREISNYSTVYEDFLGERKEAARSTIQKLATGEIERCQVELDLLKPDGCFVWIKVYAKILIDESGLNGRIMGSITDINEEKLEKTDLEKQAYKDSLTNTLNRRMLKDQIEKTIENRPDAHYALIVMDIDDFKSINDTWGHSVGDEALRKFAGALRSCSRKDEIVGRLGGDEFVLFLHLDRSSVEDEVKSRCADLFRVISSIRLDADAEYRICSSIGVAVYREDGADYKHLFECADQRLYQAKRNGKNRFVYK